VDVLSEVLRVVRLSGAIHFSAEFTHPWAILSSPPDMLTTRLFPGAEAVTPFHIATAGQCVLSWGSVAPITFEAGDVVVFSRGAQHVLASRPGMAPVPIKDIYRPSADRVTVLRHGGGGEESRFICGFLHSDQRFAPLLDAMPSLTCIRVREGALVLESYTDSGRYLEPVRLPEPTHWWQAAIAHLVAETSRSGPGNRAVLARLAELLFMEVLRWQLTYLSNGNTGWLAGLNDPHVGRALVLMHADPARGWTVEDLAREAGISRAAFAKRFVDLLGDTPMQYLAGWRMHLARSLLRGSNIGIAQLAVRVGYESEAAFSRAFRRAVGIPPATWRDASAADPANTRGAGSCGR
jgi:AraC family transcriptional regulator, alkane utilization regulator